MVGCGAERRRCFVTPQERCNEKKGFDGNKDVLFDKTGNVYNPETKELIGSLTEGGGSKNCKR